MDPDQALDDARKALSAFLAAENRNVQDDPHATLARMIVAARELADSFEALDGWLAKGGFLPRAWAHAPRAPKRV
jgi:hypothetical protein